MPLLIDGYNLLHASGILGRGTGPGGLERARAALLNFLAESLADDEVAQTTVVFDARDPPPGLPRVMKHRGLTVRFAESGSDADAMIEELVRAASAPRKLTVVSSDHRLHRAARKRRAKAVDSDRWYADVVRARIERVRGAARGTSAKPPPPDSEAEVDFWLKQFGLEVPPAPGAAEPPAIESPFPPGYGEDIRESDV